MSDFLDTEAGRACVEALANHLGHSVGARRALAAVLAVTVECPADDCVKGLRYNAPDVRECDTCHGSGRVSPLIPNPALTKEGA